MDADFLIQAGHQGKVRNSGDGTKPSHGTGGLPGPDDDEYKLTPIVANKTCDILREAGYTVIREDAFFDQPYKVKVAVFLHFDGSGTPCASGASVGYPPGSPSGSNKPTADLWREVYKEVWPFKWRPDNFTSGLRGYYGYRWTNTEVAEFLVEFGELTCPEQNVWLVRHVRDGYLAKLLAYVLDRAVGGDRVAHPGVPDGDLSGDDVDARFVAFNEIVDGLSARLVSIEADTATTSLRLDALDDADQVLQATLKELTLSVQDVREKATRAHRRLDKLHQV